MNTDDKRNKENRGTNVPQPSKTPKAPAITTQKPVKKDK